MLEVESGIIAREEAIGLDAADRRTRVETGLAEIGPMIEAAEARWTDERELVKKILDLRARLRGEGVPLDAAAEAPAPEPAMAEANGNGQPPEPPAAAPPPTATPTSPSSAP